MMQNLFPLMIGCLTVIGSAIFLLRHRVPRWAHAAGWVCGLLASAVFIAMVTVDAFQPELGGMARELAMPAPLQRGGGYWTAYGFHVAVGLAGVLCCLFNLGFARADVNRI